MESLDEQCSQTMHRACVQPWLPTYLSCGTAPVSRTWLIWTSHGSPNSTCSCVVDLHFRLRSSISPLRFYMDTGTDMGRTHSRRLAVHKGVQGHAACCQLLSAAVLTAGAWLTQTAVCTVGSE